MHASDIEILGVIILITSIRLQTSYTLVLTIAVMLACLMGTHQMYKLLAQEKSHSHQSD